MVEPLTGGIIGVILLVIFLFSGMPICIALGCSGMIGLYLIEGISGVFIGMSAQGFDQVWSIGLIAIPLFIFMGHLVVQFDLGTDLYDASYKWMGRLPGGLGIASTIMGGLFGFVCGSGLAGVATIGGLAIPEMEKRGYNRRLSLGTLALAGSVAALIPPSILMIIYCFQTMTSMGAMFLSGIIPGIILVVLIALYVMTVCMLKPSYGPPGQKFSFNQKMKSLVYLVPVLLLFLSIIGGIYKGIWSPVEAGGTACLIVTIIALFYGRRLNWNRVKQAAIGAASTSIMIYMLMIGATFTTTLFFVSGLDEVIAHLIIGLPLPRWGTIVFLLFLMMLMGMFMEVMGLLLISLPITFPVIVELGYDPIWWGILVIVSIEMSLITPPVGINLFIIKGIAPRGTTMSDIILGTMPFVGLLWVFVGLLIAFPDIVMWLPNVLMPR
jgi:tripartite ATP-independent transporter DctM subunit